MVDTLLPAAITSIPPTALSPLPTGIQPAVRRIMGDTTRSNITGSDSWVSDTGQTTFLILPTGMVAYPGMKEHGWLEWFACGRYTQVGAVQTFEVQPVVDGAAVGAAVSFPGFAAFAGQGFWRLHARLAWNHFNDGTLEQWLEASILVADAAGAIVAPSPLYKCGVYAINAALDHDISLQVRKTSAVPNPNALDIRNVNCLHLNSRSGS